MKAIQRITIFLFVVVLGLYIALQVYDRLYADHIAPAITFDSDVIEISVNQPQEDLLAGVTAKDETDGDLTDQVMVKGVTHLITDDTAKVTYIVFDAANNMATGTRTVHYTDHEKPHFALTQPLVYPLGEAVTLLDRLSASDVVEGDISGNIRVTAQNVTLNYEGIYSVIVQVTNRLGDVESVPLKLVISNAALTPTFELTDYLVYLDVGTEFDPKSYIIHCENSKRVKIDSGVNTEKAGVYDVCYSYEGYTVYLTVVVK